MKDRLLDLQKDHYGKEYKKKKRRQKIVTVLAAVVVFCTTYALILPAITWERSLVCEKDEHTHGDTCYETVTVPAVSRLVCGKEVHTHGEECYDETGALVCQIEEHEHTDACFEITEEHTETILVCQLEAHEHTDACFDAPPAEDPGYYCGIVEHVHSEEQYCYFADGTLRCTIPEHQHTLECKSDPKADVEKETDWDKSYEDVIRTGIWSDDVLAMARTQMGYAESKDNYEVLKDGETKKGYTRYGAWYGDPYGDWCAMFCSFCIDHAGVKDYPLHSNCAEWIKALSYDEDDPSRPVYYYKAGTYEPKPGDLIFFDWDPYQKTVEPEDTVPAGETLSQEDTVPAGETLPQDETAPAGETLPQSETVLVREALPQDETVPAGEMLAQDETVPADETTPAAEELPLPTEETEETETDNTRRSSGEDKRRADHIGFVAEITYDELTGEPVSITTIEGNSADKVREKTYEWTDDRILGYGRIPENPESLQERMIVSQPAKDGATAIITGRIPENAEVRIEAAVLTEAQLIEYFGEAKAAAMSGFAAYDITIWADGIEWQPDDTVGVVIEHPDITLNETDSLSVAHIDGATDQVSDVSVQLSDVGDVAFEADGFSTYIIYTVDFAFENALWSMEGGSSIRLSALFEKLGIDRAAEAVVKAEFTDPTLIEVTDLEGDWLLTSLLPFDTQEILTLTFADGTEFYIHVTDAQINASSGYWEKVSSIGDKNAKYIIVNSANGYALTQGATNRQTQIAMSAVTGQTEYYTIAAALSDAAQFTFGSAIGDGGSTTLVTNGGYYLTVGGDNNNIFNTNSANVDIRYTTNGVWRIANGNRYLQYNSAFGRSAVNTTAYANMNIYRYYPGTTENNRTFTVSVYTIPVDQNGNAVGASVYQGDLTVSPNGGETAVGNLFGNYGIDGTYAGAYFGTEYSKAAQNVTTMSVEGYDLRWLGGNDYRALHVVPAAGSDVTYTAGSSNGLYLTYTIGGGGGSEEEDDPRTQPDYTPDTDSISGAKSGAIEDPTDVVPDAGENITAAYASDASTSQIEDRFFSVPDETSSPAISPSVNDGRAETDKSVIYMDDDYDAISEYEEGTFGVTLSALGQNYQISISDSVNVPLDVVFILDVSGSMSAETGGISRREAVVNAVNEAMTTLMEANPENRAGIALFASGGDTLLELDHYTPAANGTYLTYNASNEKIYTTNGIVGEEHGNIGSVNAESNGFTQGYRFSLANWDRTGGTYTQYGIAKGAGQLIENTDTTYTATLHKDTPYEKTVTQTRQPVIILLSDGEPTHGTSDYSNVLNGTHYGQGVFINNSANGVLGYYTILTANSYKNAVSRNYGIPAKFYSIGMGIYESGIGYIGTASENTASGDHYKRAVLNPTQDNIDHLVNDEALDHANNADVMKALLENNYTGSGTISVGTSSRYTQLGTTVRYIPVSQPNPYAGDYNYADGAYFGDLTADELSDIFGDILSASMEVADYGFMLKEGTSLQLTDTIGEGMEIKGTPVLRYNGVNYELTPQGSGSSIAYICSDIAVTSDGSGSDGGERTADLSEISISVTKSSGIQTVTMDVPEALVPTYTPDVKESWYYEELPVRLIYKVGLTEAAKDEVAALAPGGTATFYTNEWEDTEAGSTTTPDLLNPYYNDIIVNGETQNKRYAPYETAKSDNTTDTAENVTRSVMEEGSVRNALGNNGRLTFTNTIMTASVLLQKTNAANVPITAPASFVLYSDAELTQQAGEEFTTDGNGQAVINDLQIGATYWLVETLSPEGYYRMPDARSFTVTGDGADVLTYDTYLSDISGVLYVKNYDGIPLPATGGIGSWPYYAIGVLLLTGAFVYSCKKRHKRERRRR